MEQIKAYEQQFDHYLSKFRTLNEIEAKTKVPKVYIAVVGYLLVTISVFFNIYADFTVSLLSVVYPTYRLLQSIQLKDHEGVKTFGFYFALVAIWDFIEIPLLDVFSAYVPYYYVVKLGALVWMFFPGYLGANVIHGVVAPHFEKLIAEKKSE
ncbi:ER membrane protein DP1/Yop1 [Irineochytrium annulatum]|nr:ER membrane protein DP1/Yop1 [Irineochytrium annulatum]